MGAGDRVPSEGTGEPQMQQTATHLTVVTSEVSQYALRRNSSITLKGSFRRFIYGTPKRFHIEPFLRVQSKEPVKFAQGSL